MLDEALVPRPSAGAGASDSSPAMSGATALILNDAAMQAIARAVAAILNARRTVWGVTGTRADGKDDDTISDTPEHLSPRVSQIILAESLYAGSPGRLQDLASLTVRRNFAEVARLVLDGIQREATGLHPTAAFDLTPYATKDPYCSAIRQAAISGPGFGRPLRAGGLREGLREALLPAVQTWIRELRDILARLVLVHRRPLVERALDQAEDDGPQILQAMCERLAELVTHRAICCNPHGGSGPGDPLAPAELENLTNPIRQGCLARAQAQLAEDARGLEALMQISLCRSGEALVALLTYLGASARRIAVDPPPELEDALGHCYGGMSIQLVRTGPLPGLVAAFDVEPIECQAILVLRWVQQHGDATSAACFQALRQVRHWEMGSQPFLQTVGPPVTATHGNPGAFAGAAIGSSTGSSTDNAATLPSPPHIGWSTPRMLRVRAARTGYDAHREVAVRLVSVVWELAHRWSELRRGSVYAGIVRSMAEQHVGEAIAVNQLVRLEILRRGLFVGPMLDLTCEELLDYEGQHANEVAVASHEVSALPIASLFALLELGNCPQRSLALLDLGARIRPLLLSSGREEERGCDLFRRDCDLVAMALEIAMPAVAELRARFRWPEGGAVPTGVAALFRSQAVRAWYDGSSRIGSCIVLRGADLRRIPPALLQWLRYVSVTNAASRGMARAMPPQIPLVIGGERVRAVAERPRGRTTEELTLPCPDLLLQRLATLNVF